ncbi:MAG: hypothetical protein R3E58_10755 [Phycisphaerae bacterium]|nr:hypothetical protein [Phycisphaerales bacterium]
MKIRSSLASVVWTSLLTIVASGCSAPHATVELIHPFEFGRQQSVKLDSEWAHYDCNPGESVARLLCEWPLPGSHYGKKEYELYLQLPASSGVFEVGAPIESFAGDTIASDSSSQSLGSGGNVISGFLIQRTGRLRGLTHITAGQVEIKCGSQCRGMLSLVCADETEIVGEFVARPGYDMTAFERDHQVDIANAKAVAQGKPLPEPAVKRP